MLNSNLLPSFKRNNVPVVLASSNLFAPYAGVFIRSLLDHASEENNYDIIIFEREISDENKRLLKNLAIGYANVSIRFYDPSPLFTSFSYANEEHHFPLETYYRIIAPHILNYPRRIITVDVDTLLKTDIARLINEDLEEYCVSGVCDVRGNGMYLRDYSAFSKKINIRDYFQNVLGFGSNDIQNYVNSGLLLFDCDKYVLELDIETILSTAQQGGYIFEDQDVLNVLMKGKIKHLDFSWNVSLPLNQREVELFEAGSKLHNGAYEQSRENPYLLHWSSRPKPWVCPDVPYGSEWWQTALRTPFVGHIIARMADELEKRREYYRKRYGKEVDEIWNPSPKEIDRTNKL